MQLLLIKARTRQACHPRHDQNEYRGFHISSPPSHFAFLNATISSDVFLVYHWPVHCTVPLLSPCCLIGFILLCYLCIFLLLCGSMALEALWKPKVAHAAYLVWKNLVSKSLLRVDGRGSKAEFMAIFLGIEIFGYLAAWFSV